MTRSSRLHSTCVPAPRRPARPTSAGAGSSATTRASRRGAPARTDIQPLSAPSHAPVLHVSAECWPYVRTGGLGEAVAALAAHQAAHAPVAVVVPLYRKARQSLDALGVELVPASDVLPLAVGSWRPETQLYRPSAALPGTPDLVFVRCDEAFDRAGIYGEGAVDFADNARRFAVLCHAALHALRGRAGGTPAILHAHDWHAGLALLYLRTTYAHDPALRGVASVLTVHNAAFQQHLSAEDVGALDLPAELYDWRCLEWYGRANLLKGALAVADHVTTVSPTHAEELCTSLGGFGLHDAFTALGERLVGIRNGIDLTCWDPRTDVELPMRYGPDALDGKRVCKAALQKAMGLAIEPAVPLIAVCARLDRQKGFDLLLSAGVLERPDVQVVVLGEGETRYADALHARADAAPDRVAVCTRFSDAAERRLLAGADLALVPSVYEPCGLAQLRAQRYGALPVAHRVGGLADTIIDGVNGILFATHTRDALDDGIARALNAYRVPSHWHTIVGTTMRADVGWMAPASEYARVYRAALASRVAMSR